MKTILALLVVCDPFSFARVWPQRYDRSLAGAVVLTVAALVADPVLDTLDLSMEAFWIAAGVVVLVPALGRVFGGETRDVAGPAPPLVAIALATRDGLGITLVAVGVVLVVAWLVQSRGRTRPLVERVMGALMVVIAFDLIRDGVIAV